MNIINKNMLMVLAGLIFLSCQTSTESRVQKTEKEKVSYDLSDEFKSYWFDGKAEVSSYNLKQMRYGESREGTAVLIFVKEPFLVHEQVKANSASELSFDVIKLNTTKKFNTGIYPYSIMQSTFSPLTIDKHAIKVTSSTQEWCGQTYMQLNNRDNFEIFSHSYFEGEADQQINLDKTMLENEIWTKLRLNPVGIKAGEHKIIPDFSYIRLKHIETKAYKADVSQQKIADTIITTLAYKDLDRILKIYQKHTFPFSVLKWEEKQFENDKNFTTAVLQKQIKIDYWNKNSNTFAFLRDSLQLN